MKNQIFNPYLPSYEYIPDGEPRVFGERLYIFGSHDRFNGTDFCQNDYVCWSTPIDDLSAWRYEGVIYRKDQHPYKIGKGLFYAPDVTQGPDGRYYLYYSVADSCIMSVAVSDNPAGPYEYYGDIKDEFGHVIGSSEGDYYQFDPSILVDDDGRIFLYSGFSPLFKKIELGRKSIGAFVMELNQDMLTVKAEPKIIIPKKMKNAGKNNFFEASSIRKINGIYYFVYSSFIGGLCYATSKYPDRDFIYGGMIHSNFDFRLNGHNLMNPAYPVGNNHGGIVCIKGQYYIFNHRMTNKTLYSRQGTAEPITIESDGSIKQVETTSCGLNGGPLIGKGEYPAYIACCLMGKRLFIGMQSPSSIPYITQEGEDREGDPNQYIASMKNGSTAGYKYFDFDKVSRISVKVRGEASGELQVKLSEKGAVVSRIKLTDCGKEWTEFSSEFKLTSGVYPLYFIFKGKGEFDFMSFSIQ
ncbi:family 43 glycosylhydrolase [Clostridium diolis]|uniref:family 43 glycosylhydrolase n=1 Tax=Clostridium diolis TaxID=223919 RepID=UPI003AF6DF8A